MEPEPGPRVRALRQRRIRRASRRLLIGVAVITVAASTALLVVIVSVLADAYS